MPAKARPVSVATKPETTNARVRLRAGADSSRNQCRGDTRQATYNRGPFDIATLAIFSEYIEFDGGEVLRLVVEGAAGRTVA
jgi:hypothetical protein